MARHVDSNIDEVDRHLLAVSNQRRLVLCPNRSVPESPDTRILLCEFCAPLWLVLTSGHERAQETQRKQAGTAPAADSRR